MMSNSHFSLLTDKAHMYLRSIDMVPGKVGYLQVGCFEVTTLLDDHIPLCHVLHGSPDMPGKGLVF